MRDSTTSVWTLLLDPSKREEYSNALFASSRSHGILEPSTHPSSVQLWTDYYFRFIDVHAGRGTSDLTKGIKKLVNEKNEVVDSLAKSEDKCRKVTIKLLKQKEEYAKLENELAALKKKLSKKHKKSILMEDTVRSDTINYYLTLAYLCIIIIG